LIGVLNHPVVAKPSIDPAQPLVSVIIRTFNRLSFLKDAIESVRAQTYVNWELIVVDDGSTDDTIEAVTKINDPRISLLALPHTGNINYLINEGAKKCRGEWLAFLDSDDLWLPQKLELQLKVLQETQRKWCYCPFRFVDEENRLLYNSQDKCLPYQGNILNEVIAAQTGITICSVVVEKNFFDEIGRFSSDPTLREDYEFFLRIASKAEVAYASQTLTCIREHPHRVYKSRKHPSERTAMAYAAFLKQKPGKKYEKLARRRMAFLLSEAAVHRSASRDYRKAVLQLLEAFFAGDQLRHWLSAFKRSIMQHTKRMNRVR
jgi:glycosyltransferase involved in cell wall biosynthesis